VKARIKRTLAFLGYVGPDIVQTAGLASVVTGAFVLAPWLGLFVLGVGLILVGRALASGEGPPEGGDD